VKQKTFIFYLSLFFIITVSHYSLSTDLPSHDNKPFAELSPDAEENSAILLQACTVFQKARKCFKKTKNILETIFCADKWKDPSREERNKLIEYGFISQEEYDNKRMIYKQNRKICKKKARSEGFWFFDQKLIEYRCFRPVALDYMDIIIDRFNCDLVVPSY